MQQLNPHISHLLITFCARLRENGSGWLRERTSKNTVAGNAGRLLLFLLPFLQLSGLVHAQTCTPPTATLNASPANCQGSSIALKLTAAGGTAPYSVVVNGVTYPNVTVGQNFASISAEQSVWGTTGSPATPNDYDGQSIEVGVKIRSTQAGTITGIRFYKGTSNTGTHTGNFWSSTGTKLATATFINETASGWQEVRFTTPVSITANTVYVASYFSSGGRYASTENFFTSTGVTSGSLTALQAGVSGVNGVYKLGATGFPTLSYASSNYWVDVIFKPASYTFNLTSITDAAACNNTGNVSTATITQAQLQSGSQTFYRDADGDTYGNPSITQVACTAPAGYVAVAGDCNDNDAAIRPGATEICDGKDNNCNGTVDEGCATNTYYRDADGDTYGNPALSTTGITAPAGYVSNNTDCNDNSASVHPGAAEICNNGIDENCNGTADEGCVVTNTYYRDADGDGYGNPAITTTGSTPPAGYVASNADCNDNSASVHPGATEICNNGIDENCNGTVDEGCVVAPVDRPIMVITAAANPFSSYFAEILRAEGLNEFTTKDITQVTATDLNTIDVVILGEMTLTTANLTMLTNWVNAGGTLITMRPDPQLLPLLGLTAAAGSLSNKYLLVNTASDQGKGIVGVTIQFHGTANLYTLNGATSLATLYSAATTATTNPAVTIRDVGTNGGQAIAFAYDLARSIVYTRQGNPAFAGQERDGQSPIRSDDQYFGNASFDPQPDWIDFNKIAIPQADEQQHLLTNIILKGNADKKPLPRFWFLPRGLKATIVMTGDDHANGGTAGRFDQYKALSSSNTLAAVNNWSAIRGSSYLFPNAPLTNLQAQGYQADSFDISLHLNTECTNFTLTSLQNDFTTQLQQLATKYPSLAAPTTHRTHCLLWSDWASQPKVESSKRIRLDVNYYYWPGTWIQNRSGMFTGSGMPMRYADLDGSIIDSYQVTTQMTDESEQIFPDFVDSLLDNATGPEGYYGVFCANMHTDNVASTGSDAIINSAVNHGVPVVSAKQMLTWLDGRNASTLGSFSWNNNTLNFSISVASGARSLEAMLPMDQKTSRLTTITLNGSAVSYRIEIIKGIQYAIFTATTGNYVASYNGVPCTPPTATLNASSANCQGSAIALKLTSASGLAPYTVVVNGQTYSNVIVGQSFANVSPEESIWGNTGTPQNPNVIDGQAVELGVKFRASQNGTILGIRFLKGSSNTATHTGNLWSATGTKLATATFINESATGWQEVRFATPVAVTANTTYIASYLSPGGVYAYTPNFFTSSVSNGSLTALQAGIDGANGVYLYGGGFPNQAGNNSNYWVDVLFKPSGSYTFNLTSISDARGCDNSGNLSTATINQSDLQAGSQTFYQDNDGDTYGNSAVTQTACTAPAGFVARGGDCNDADAAIHPGATEICDGKDNNCDGRIDEGCTTYYRDFDNDTYGNPANTSIGTTPPTGYVLNNKDCNDSSAAINPGAVEVCGNGKDDNCNGTIDEGCVVSPEQSIWGATGTPQTPNDYDGQTIEVGVKFRASQAGTITGIRFYKGVNNTGTHTGNLWTSTGTKLATATFINESATGWQEVRFATPVSITANTVYVASYFSTSGRYGSTENFFTTKGVTNGALTALQAGVSGANGVYKLGATGFPTLSYLNSNYWVDVLYRPGTTGASAGKMIAQVEGVDRGTNTRLSVEVVPNYSASSFTLLTHGSGKGSMELRVIDALGRVVETKRGLADNASISIGSNYRPGSYFVQVIQGSERVMVKLIKVSR